MTDAGTSLSLLCRVRTRWCALPLAQVIETMRPLPIDPLPGAPSFVLGLAVIRGVPVPVLDAARLLGAPEGHTTRFITIRTGDRQVAFAVDDVVGTRMIPDSDLQALPPLLREACAKAVAAIGSLDAELLLVLNHARLVSEDLWAKLDASAASP